MDIPDDPQITGSLSDYLNHTIDSYSDSDFHLISSNPSSKLAGFPAYSLKYTDKNADDNSTYTALEMGTIISGKVLFVNYRADSSSFAKFLPTALKMIDSLEITESVIAQTVKPTQPSASPPEQQQEEPSSEPSTSNQETTVTPADVRVVSVNAERTAGFFTVHYLVTGVITNQGGSESNPIQLKLTVSDHGEPVIEKVFTPVTERLQVGQSAEFSVPFTISGDITFDYKVEVVSQ